MSLGAAPGFPAFRPLTLEDRNTIEPFLRAYAPTTSELTFSSVFTWRRHYQTSWCVDGDHLLILMPGALSGGFALPPIGPPPRDEVSRNLLAWMRDVGNLAEPRIDRADRRLVKELERSPRGGMTWTGLRADFDYVYRVRELIELKGRRYHAKRNHITRAEAELGPTYARLTTELVEPCLELLSKWCEVRHCEEDLSLSGDREATGELLRNYVELGVRGGVLLVEGRIAAFGIGEPLNQRTMMIHGEKVDPEHPRLYAVINRRLLEHEFTDFEEVNRGHDLGIAGLRKAKESYHPSRMEQKYRVTLDTARA